MKKFIILFMLMTSITTICFNTSVFAAMRASHSDSKLPREEVAENKETEHIRITINKRLRAIDIDGGFFEITDYELLKTETGTVFKKVSVILHRQILDPKADESKRSSWKVVGDIKYYIEPEKTTFSTTYRLNMGWIEISDEAYRMYGLATLLGLVTLHDPEIMQYDCKHAFVIALNDKSAQLYTKIGFVVTEEDFFCTCLKATGIATLLQEKTNALVESALTKLRKKSVSVSVASPLM